MPQIHTTLSELKGVLSHKHAAVHAGLGEFGLSKISYALTAPGEDEDAALGAADYVYIMHEGMIKVEGNPEEIKSSSDIREAYLGI